VLHYKKAGEKLYKEKPSIFLFAGEKEDSIMLFMPFENGLSQRVKYYGRIKK
jgi:hypothetical protein